ncbi:MAG: class I SAM-dependent methyltransferase [Candidatus Hydrogenedentes bacterium]|nr:class I SAM-dependent methyltransferase [Candidatus Hydrogenedentota bacterium]
MKICPHCQSPFDSTEWKCPICSFAPPTDDGILLLAPDVDMQDTTSKAERVHRAPRKEEKNFWFEARNRIIVCSIRRYFSTAKAFLEIGCGNGVVLQAIHEAFPEIDLFGADVSKARLTEARQYFERPAYWQLDARNIPFKDELDLVGAFDVIEHIEEDERVLKELYKALTTGGGLLLTVPQHPFLWSPRDEWLTHVRRYRRCELIRKVQTAGFEVRMVTSFISLPFPAMLLACLRNRYSKRAPEPFAALNQGKLTNAALNMVLSAEFQLLEAGLRPPFGGSLFLAAEKV